MERDGLKINLMKKKKSKVFAKTENTAAHIIELRKSGFSYRDIERSLGIPERVAVRIYENKKRMS